MAHLIDKSALVTEIEKKRDRIKKGIFSIPLTGRDRAFATIEYEILGKIKEFLDTLEVKEVDLEKHLKEDIEDVFYDLNGVAVKGATYYLTVEDVKDIAKHFFELGLKAQKGE